MESELLVADIGGTNVRFAIANIDDNLDITLESIKVFSTPSIKEAHQFINIFLFERRIDRFH